MQHKKKYKKTFMHHTNEMLLCLFQFKEEQQKLDCINSWFGFRALFKSMPFPELTCNTNRTKKKFHTIFL